MRIMRPVRNAMALVRSRRAALQQLQVGITPRSSIRAFSVSAPSTGATPTTDHSVNVLRPERVAGAKKQYSLVDELPGLPQLKPASQLSAPQTEITTLPSGMRVISQDTYGQAATVGIFVDAGSRYEEESEVGVTHLLEHLGFKSTTTRSHAELVREVEEMGALTTASCGREQIIYTVDVLRDNVDRALDLLADSVLNVELVPEELEQIKNVMRIQTEDMMENPPALLQEFIHTAAYGSSQPLGRPMQCPLDRIDDITLETVKAFRAKHFVAEKMVLAGSGVDHSALVAMAEKLFADIPRASSDSSASPLILTPSKADYQGGLYTLNQPDSEFSYASLAFPTRGGWHDDDLVPVCVLHTLLGGGDSFSAGGPGKGMYSRLYTSVLNRFYWVESAFAFSSIHADVGLLGIYGAGSPAHTGNLVALLCNQLLHVATVPVGAEELARAKNQLKSSVLMNLESRMILYEDIGRQLLTYGMREDPEEVCAKIDAVTADDVQRVIRDAMQHPPSLVFHGDLARFPEYEQVVRGLQEGLRPRTA